MMWVLLFVFVMPFHDDFSVRPVAYVTRDTCEAAYEQYRRDLDVAWLSPCRAITEKDFARLARDPYALPTQPAI